jgi:hypothetical protein
VACFMASHKECLYPSPPVGQDCGVDASAEILY